MLKIIKELHKDLVVVHSSIKEGKIRDRIKAIILLNDGYSKTEIEKKLCIPHFLPYNSWKKVRYE